MKGTLKTLKRVGITQSFINIMNKKVKVSLEDLKLESYITSVDSEKAKRIAGGNAASHATHTQRTDREHICTGVVCKAAV
jgi:hypothetical protein